MIVKEICKADIFWTTDKKIMEMAQEFVACLSDTIEVCQIAIPFKLELVEFHGNGDDASITWGVTVDINCSSSKNYLVAEASQAYIASNNSDHSEDYLGSVNMKLKSEHQKAPRYTGVVLNLANASYAKVIKKYYPEWETHYIDALTIT